MSIFLGVVMLNPTIKEKEDGKQTQIIVPVTAISACTKEQATMKMSRLVPKEYSDSDDLLEVVVCNPF